MSELPHVHLRRDEEPCPGCESRENTVFNLREALQELVEYVEEGPMTRELKLRLHRARDTYSTPAGDLAVAEMATPDPTPDQGGVRAND